MIQRTVRLRRGAQLLAAALTGLAIQAASAADLTANIKNLRGQAGTVYVALFDTAEGFPKSEKSIAGQYLPVHEGVVRAAFLGLKPGRYALSVYQDENGNGKLDTNLLGIPLERFGFSRDATGTMGPPSFDAAALDIDGATTIDINLR